MAEIGTTKSLRTASTAGDGSGRRETVLDAALTLFAERGYHATTINDIGRALDVRGPSLYNHISSKHELLIEIMARFAEYGLEQQHQVLSEISEPTAQLSRLVDVHVRINAQFRREAFVAAREVFSLEEPHRTRFIEYRDLYSHTFVEAIQRGAESGVFATEDPKLATNAIIGMGIHIAGWFQPNGRLSETELSAAYQRYALRLVSAEQDSRATS